MALEPINYTTHSREIEQQYLKVVRGDDQDTTWLILSPDSSKDYQPEFTGNDFTEFLQTFDETKVQFGMARVSPPGSDVEKLILIGWCPDSAPMKTRASFAANFGAVANNVLKGYHVQVTARDEDDLNEEDLLAKISNAAGARYSIQSSDHTNISSSRTRSSPVPRSNPKPVVKKPIVSTPPPVQKKPIVSTPTPVANKQPESVTDDWDEPEVEERDFDKNPLKPNQSTYKPIGKIDLQKVIAEEKAKEDPRLVHQVEKESSSKKIDPKSDIANLKEQSKLRRDNEINNFLGTKPPLQSRIDDNDKVIKGFRNEKSPAQLWAEKKAAQRKEDTGNNDELEVNSNILTAKTDDQTGELEQVKDNSEAEQDGTDIQDLKSKFEKLASQTDEPQIITPKQSSRTTSQTNDLPPPPKRNIKQIGTPLPGMHNEISEPEDEENDEDWDDQEDTSDKKVLTSTAPSIDVEHEPENGQAPPSLPSRNRIPETEPEEEEEAEEETESKIESEEEKEEQKIEQASSPAPKLPSRGSGAPPPPPRRTVEPEQEEKAAPWAIAEYDYEAGEDNELTFEESDKIINIEFVDDDWWLGELEKTGEKGLFPSNYVSLGN